MTIDPFSASGFVGIAFGLMVGLPLGVWGAFQQWPSLDKKPAFCPACGYEVKGDQT